ncbi:MAG: acetyltransferase [Muribaculaceae bacterium]|nr:acetyltransferase [Muribaculaceae bacterium]
MAAINLFGSGGHARVVMDIIAAGGDTVGVMYDDAPRCGGIGGTPVLRAGEAAVRGPLIVAIGSCRARRLVAERYGVEFATAVHPSAVVSPSATLGEGTVVMPGAVINSGASVGSHCIINTRASVDHDCRVGDYVHVAPGCTLSGDVRVGDGSWIGVGSCVRQGVSIGRGCLIGAGSVVVGDIPDGSVAYGNPCRVVRWNEPWDAADE